MRVDKPRNDVRSYPSGASEEDENCLDIYGYCTTVIRPTLTVVEEDPRIRNDSRSDTGDNDGSNGGSRNQRSDASMPDALKMNPQAVKDINEDEQLVLPAILWGTRWGGRGSGPRTQCSRSRWYGRLSSSRKG